MLKKNIESGCVVWVVVILIDWLNCDVVIWKCCGWLFGYSVIVLLLVIRFWIGSVSVVFIILGSWVVMLFRFWV